MEGPQICVQLLWVLLDYRLGDICKLSTCRLVAVSLHWQDHLLLLLEELNLSLCSRVKHHWRSSLLLLEKVAMLVSQKLNLLRLVYPLQLVSVVAESGAEHSACLVRTLRSVDVWHYQHPVVDATEVLDVTRNHLILHVHVLCLSRVRTPPVISGVIHG